MKNSCSGIKEYWCCKAFALTGRLADCYLPRALPWARSFCPFRACCLRLASSLSFGRGDKAAESGDVDYEYHHIIKGLYATCSSWYIDPCQPS